MKKKLILFMPSIEGGGVEKNFIIISNYLANKFSNTILITSEKKHNKFFKNLKIINPKIKTDHNSSRRFKYILCLIELIKLIIKNKNYLVFAFQANVYCAIICKFFKIKIIIRSNSSPSGWKLNIFRKKIFQLLLSLPDKIIVNSIQFRHEYKKNFNLNSVCIYNPLNKNEIIKLSKLKLKDNFFDKYKNLKIIFVGRLVDQKDPFTFVKSLNLLKNRIKFRALIVGRGHLKPKLQKYISSNNLIKNIKMIDWQKNPYRYIAQADVLVLTSNYEGLPNTLLETIALKKNVMSTDCPTGPKEILDNGKGGFLFKIGDYKSLSKLLMKFNKNDTNLKRKINYAWKRLNRFDYQINLKRFFLLIKAHI